MPATFGTFRPIATARVEGSSEVFQHVAADAARFGLEMPR